MMDAITFADVVHQSITFSKDVPAQALVLKLIDNRWLQRLRDVHQTANTRLLYMFSEHSRFGHCVGVAYLANLLMDRLSKENNAEIERYRVAVSAAAALHDIGHLAPGSHIAYKVWFPNSHDAHEEVAVRVINEDKELNDILSSYGADVPKLVEQILLESDKLPPWTWEIISGGGWNVDRGNWCIVDSILAGVSYGKYNIPALTDSIVLTKDKHLALRENRLDAMMHFALSRHAMYRQIYQHRVLLAADVLTQAIVKRARDLGTSLSFADAPMEKLLAAKRPSEVSLDILYHMRESWWRYHLMRWTEDQDSILKDLSNRLLNRRLLKTVAIRSPEERETLRTAALNAISKLGLDSRYYLHEISTVDMHEGDYKKSMLVLMDDGRVRLLAEAEPLFHAMVNTTKQSDKRWFAMPEEVKKVLGRER